MKKLAKVLVPLLALALMFGLTACGVTINEITIPAMVEINIGDTTTLEVTYTPDKENVSTEALLEAADKLTLAWESSDDSIATVDSTGKVTAIKSGEATITASDGNGLTATTKVTVRVPLMGFEAEQEMQLYINGVIEDIVPSKPLVVGPIPANADDYAPVYESADESIATVDEDGVVTAVSNGSTTITVKSGEIQTKVEITVYTVPSAFYAQDMELIVGTSDNLEVEIEGEDITFGTDFTYESSDEEIATVDEDGIVTAVGEGEAQITVQSETGAASAAIVHVKPKPAPAATANRGNGSVGSSSGNSGGSAGATGGGPTGDTGASGGDEAIETAGPAPEPAPEPEPEPEPEPTSPSVEHYHGGNGDTGMCPVPGCGLYYYYMEEPLNQETHPELYS